MYKIIGGRGIGKTTKLIEQAVLNSNPCIIVCNSPVDMREKISSLGYSCITDNIIPITYEQYIYGDENDGYDVYIDEIDKLLYCYDPMIEGYTLSQE